MLKDVSLLANSFHMSQHMSTWRISAVLLALLGKNS